MSRTDTAVRVISALAAFDCALDWAAMDSIEEIRLSDGAARGKRRAVESP
jgi:hypothetical protein